MFNYKQKIIQNREEDAKMSDGKPKEITRREGKKREERAITQKSRNAEIINHSYIPSKL